MTDHTYRFDEDSHTYYIDGVEVVSVTQALNEAGMIDSKWWTEWARHRGSTVHKCLEFLVKGTLDLNSVYPKIQGYLDAYERFRDDTQFVCAEVERHVWSPSQQAGGTLDQIGRLRDGTAIVDTKTGALQWQTATQLTGYADLYKEETGTYVDKLIGLQLNLDGTYNTRVYLPELLDWRAALRVAHRIRRGSKRA